MAQFGSISTGSVFKSPSRQLRQHRSVEDELPSMLSPDEQALLRQLESAFDIDEIDSDVALPILAELHEQYHWPLPALASYVAERSGMMDEADMLVFDRLSDYMETAA